MKSASTSAEKSMRTASIWPTGSSSRIPQSKQLSAGALQENPSDWARFLIASWSSSESLQSSGWDVSRPVVYVTLGTTQAALKTGAVLTEIVEDTGETALLFRSKRSTVPGGQIGN